MPIIESRVKNKKTRKIEAAQSGSDVLLTIKTPIAYLPAMVKRMKNDFLIEYYIINPASMKMERRRMRLNRARKRFPTLIAFKIYANEICAKVNMKLASGWNPFYEEDDMRLYVPISDVCKQYLAEKGRELRPDSVRVYTSFCKILTEWCDIAAPGIYCSMFNRGLAVRFMDYIYNKRGRRGENMRNKSWNNMLKHGKSLFSWSKEKLFCKENPFDGIKAKREQVKMRMLIDCASRKIVRDYLSVENPGMLLTCELVFSALLRPKEIRMLKVADVDIDRHCIYVSSEVAKNHHERYAPLTPELCEKLELWIKGKNGGLFLLGFDWTPSDVPCPEQRMRKTWDKVRKALKLPQEMQLYSFRDTGINNMIKSGIDPLTVMQAADHHDLAMTTRYANHRDDRMIDKIREDAPKF